MVVHFVFVAVLYIGLAALVLLLAVVALSFLALASPFRPCAFDRRFVEIPYQRFVWLGFLAVACIGLAA